MPPRMMRMRREVQETGTDEEVNLLRVVPAWTATKEGGATPMKVPTKKGTIGTPNTGEVILMNQFGRKGVTRKKMM